MFERLKRFRLNGDAADFGSGALVGVPLGVIASSTTADLIVVALLFVILRALNKTGRRRRSHEPRFSFRSGFSLGHPLTHA